VLNAAIHVRFGGNLFTGVGSKCRLTFPSRFLNHYFSIITKFSRVTVLYLKIEKQIRFLASWKTGMPTDEEFHRY
jgi:hypothetical protein